MADPTKQRKMLIQEMERKRRSGSEGQAPSVGSLLMSLFKGRAAPLLGNQLEESDVSKKGGAGFASMLQTMRRPIPRSTIWWWYIHKFIHPGELFC